MRFSKALKLGLFSVTVATMLCACGGNASMEEVLDNSETINGTTATDEQTTENMIADGEDVTDVEGDDSTEKSGSGILDDLTSNQTTSGESQESELKENESEETPAGGRTTNDSTVAPGTEITTTNKVDDKTSSNQTTTKKQQSTTEQKTTVKQTTTQPTT